MKNDDSVFRGVFKGFERLSVDISLRRHYRSFEEHVQTVARAVKPAQMCEEWLSIGKMMAGAEDFFSVDLHFPDGILKQVLFKAMLGHQRWINFTSPRLFNVHASADNLAGFLEGYTNLKTLALIRVAIPGDLLMNGVVGPLAYRIDDLLVWGDLAARVAARLTLESVALFCLPEEEVSLSESIWTCGRTPFCWHIDVKEAFFVWPYQSKGASRGRISCGRCVNLYSTGSGFHSYVLTSAFEKDAITIYLRNLTFGLIESDALVSVKT